MLDTTMHKTDDEDKLIKKNTQHNMLQWITTNSAKCKEKLSLKM